jgi:uncharacterized OB-fold protein
MNRTTHQHVQYDDFLDALLEGDGFYLECSNGHPSFPPHQVCSVCGESDVTKQSLSDRGTVIAHTIIHVPPPRFRDRAPYVVAIADLDGVELTGHLVNEAVDAIENGAEVSVTADRTDQTNERYIKFRLV